MNSRYKDKLVGVYAPGSYDHTSVLGQTQEFSRWFWANHEDMEYISTKLGINAKKLNRILTLEQLPDEELLAMGTKREIAEQLGVSASTIGYYGTPVYARRTSDNGRRLVVQRRIEYLKIYLKSRITLMLFEK